jgi:uncharacterized membrane protein
MTPQQRADRLRILREELLELRRQQILELTPEQDARIEEHFAGTLRQLAERADVDTSDQERRLSLGMRIISALGGAALCAALALFLARYLGHWPVWLQVSVLVAAPLLLTLLAGFAARRERTLYFTGLICLVAIAAFVANLSILGAIFNITPTPDALAAWGLFAIALAYHFGLRIPLAAGLVSLIAWLTTSSMHWRSFWWLNPPDRIEDMALCGLIVAALPLVVRRSRRTEFPAVYRVTGLMAFFIAVLVLSIGGRQTYLPWSTSTVESFYQAVGLASSAGAVWLGIARNWHGIVNTGTAFFALYLLLRLIDWWWDWMPEYLFFLLIGLILLAMLAVFKRLRARMRRTT